MRLPLAGGGTDIYEFYSRHGSFFISGAIDHYMYLAVKRLPIQHIRVAYSQVEEVKSIKKIRHPIVKNVLKLLRFQNERGLEITSMGDLPAGSGMGSSGSYTVGLLNAIHHLQKNVVPANILAKEACYVNMHMLKEPSGKQDEYIAAYGGIMCFEISQSGLVKAYPLKINYATVKNLQDNLLMFYTGVLRSASGVLAKQKEAICKNSRQEIKLLKKIQEIGYEIKEALEVSDLTRFGRLLHKHWLVKRERVMTSSKDFDRIYDLAIQNGALGGKLMGAGGGGFFVFYCEKNQLRLRRVLKQAGLEEVKYQFDFEGSKLLLNV